MAGHGTRALDASSVDRGSALAATAQRPRCLDRRLLEYRDGTYEQRVFLKRFGEIPFTRSTRRYRPHHRNIASHARRSPFICCRQSLEPLRLTPHVTAPGTPPPDHVRFHNQNVNCRIATVST